METLPNKLSALLRIAVEDARKSEDQGHILNMGGWFSLPRKEDEDNSCHVCMAGAVMLQRLGGMQKAETSSYGELFPNDFEQNRHLYAINEMREGMFLRAWGSLNNNAVLSSTMDNRIMLAEASALVQDDFDEKLDRAPWETYLKAADMLKAAGL